MRERATAVLHRLAVFSEKTKPIRYHLARYSLRWTTWVTRL
jgi:hypothetical protein